MRMDTYRRLLPITPYTMPKKMTRTIGLRGPSGLGQDWGSIFGSIDIGSGITSDISSNIANAVDAGINTLDSMINKAIGTSSSGFDPVPMENWVNYNVLKPVSDAIQIQAVKNDLPTLQALYSFITTAQSKWYAYLQAHWGSAAQNSYNRLIPYFNGLETALQQYMSALGGSPTGNIPGTNIPYPGTTTVFGMSATTLLLLGVGAYFLLRKRGGAL